MTNMLLKQINKDEIKNHLSFADDNTRCINIITDELKPDEPVYVLSYSDKTTPNQDVDPLVDIEVSIRECKRVGALKA